MSKLRSVNTCFWSDPWVEDLTPTEKLLYLYFITNEKTNMLGVYELSIKKISFETGIDKQTIQKALKGFETINKVRYTKNHIILLNFAKHQNYNTNMKISAIDVFNSLPKELKVNKETIDRSNASKGFERVLCCLGMVRKVEVEDELEDEVKIENENKKSDLFDTFWNLYAKKEDRKKSFSKWMNLKIETMETIIEVVPKYVKQKPEIKYRKNPVTFLNNRSWEDEIIAEKEKPQKVPMQKAVL
jgi:hypothetical protein